MNDFEEVLKGITKCNALDQLTEDEKIQLAELGTIDKYQKGEILFTFEQKGDAFFIVLSGYLRAFLRTSQKKKFKAGQLFGEVPIFGGRNRTGIIRAAENSTLVRFEKRDIYDSNLLSDNAKLNLTLALTKHIVSYFYEEPINIHELIKKGESETLEFKQSIHEKNYENILQTIIAMCNHKGGTILIGVRDDKTIVGTSFNTDKLMTDIENFSYSKLGNDLLTLTHIAIETADNRNIIRIECEPSHNFIFWDTDGKKDVLFVRANAANRKLETIKEVATYLQRRYNN